MSEEGVIQWLLDHYWLAIGIFGTLIVVQMFKGAFKHLFPDMDRFPRKVVIFGFAIIAGNLITRYFMDGDPDQEKWAMAVALFNPVIYICLLLYATYSRKLWLVALLKSRRFVVSRDAEGNIIERVVDEDGQTIGAHQHRRRLKDRID